MPTSFKSLCWPLVVTVSLCASSVSAAASLRVGVITSITGRNASEGAQQLAGFAASVAHINQTKRLGSQRLSLIVKDDASNAAQAVLAAHSLAARGARIIFAFDTPDTFNALSTFAASERRPLVFLSTRTNTGDSPYVLRLAGLSIDPRDKQPRLGKQLGNVARSTPAIHAYLGLLAAADTLRDVPANRPNALPESLARTALSTPYGTLRFTTATTAAARSARRP